MSEGVGHIYSVRVRRVRTREEREDDTPGFIIRPLICTSIKRHPREGLIVCGHVLFEAHDKREDEKDYPPMMYVEMTPSRELFIEGKKKTWSEGFISKVVG